MDTNGRQERENVLNLPKEDMTPVMVNALQDLYDVGVSREKKHSLLSRESNVSPNRVSNIPIPVETLTRNLNDSSVQAVRENRNFNVTYPSPSTFCQKTPPAGSNEGSSPEPPKKRRARGAKFPGYQPKNPKKIKFYEISEPFDDREKERRRRNAVNAKRHRELQKEEKESLEKQIADLAIEKDIFKHENQELKAIIKELRRDLEKFRSLSSDQNSTGFTTTAPRTITPGQQFPDN
ncbi:hypothetical protein SK128_016803 [Halocaridina rubra]|uniref:BZIP domain-containing protein n=1 Tax=Halocaridina rubra TaxID=373956 RepID=A0AAN8XCX4_HALRR